jgi:hypothetical protein
MYEAWSMNFNCNVRDLDTRNNIRHLRSDAGGPGEVSSKDKHLVEHGASPGGLSEDYRLASGVRIPLF